MPTIAVPGVSTHIARRDGKEGKGVTMYVCVILRLRGVPAEVLRGCSSLARLSLHGNPLTIEQLRAADGFREFNARRCARCDKQVQIRGGLLLESSATTFLQQAGSQTRYVHVCKDICGPTHAWSMHDHSLQCSVSDSIETEPQPAKALPCQVLKDC